MIRFLQKYQGEGRGAPARPIFIAVGSPPPCDVPGPPTQRGVAFGAGGDLRQGADPSAESSSLSESVAVRPALLN